MRMSVRVGAVIGVMLPMIVLAAPAGASRTATVRIYDRYNHGRVKVEVNGTSHRLAFARHTGWFPIEPSPSRNDGVAVTSLRHRGCGEGSVGWYFRPGHRYKITIIGTRDRCHFANGKSVRGPEFRITKVR